MMNRSNWKSLQLMVVVFIILNGFFISARALLLKKGIDQSVVLVGNLVLFAVSLIAFLLTQKTLENKNPHVFVRAVYSGFIIKFFIVVLAAFVYFQLVDVVNKPALFVVLVLYLVYTFIEVSSLLRLLKGKQNA
ncbi:MAG: hypothetical protein EOO05_17730 [Chitinophagaceae bacterium]|nr:MAG: hypothetical protein EOO05_17730 [Chitinophagaceae bacterium]